ncbi:MAG TPA: DMT family transporter [Geobacterales bacterium]|nr:DMT family transporter [Geobacterales bacterium]
MVYSAKRFLYIFFTILCWGLSYPLSKIALSYMTPIILAFIRSFIGGLILMLFVRKIISGRKEFIDALLNVGALLILLNLGIYFSLNPGLASVMLYTQPVFTIIISSIFLKEPIMKKELLGVVLAFSGILISVNSLEFDYGVLFALLGGFIWSVGTIYHSKHFKNTELLSLHTFMSLVSSVFIVPLIPIGFYFIFSLKGILVALALTILAQVFGYIAWFKSINEIGPIMSGTFSLLVPVMAYITTYLILGIKPSLLTLIGSAVTLFGVFFAMRSHK